MHTTVGARFGFNMSNYSVDDDAGELGTRLCVMFSGEIPEESNATVTVETVSGSAIGKKCVKHSEQFGEVSIHTSTILEQ